MIKTIVNSVFFILLWTGIATSQSIKGKVTGSNNEPLVGCSIYWSNSTVGTTSDQNGKFEITTNNINIKRLIFSYVSFQTDTVDVGARTTVNVQLKESQVISDVEITGRGIGSHISSIDPIKTQVITEVELTRSACCDLAGCFETDASVEPSTTNIVTNAKELRILGLSGVYNQVLTDGFPHIQGLSYTYGISSIPGTLVEKIFVAKGAVSVLQGYDGFTGQINVIPKESGKTDKLLLNAYTNSFYEKQFNANFSQQWKSWGTFLALHTARPGERTDEDKDNFTDLPLLTRYNIYNKWKYRNEDSLGISTKFAFRYLNETRIGGEMEFDPSLHEGTSIEYGQTVYMQQPEVYSKSTYRFNMDNVLVLFASAYQHDQLAYFGITRYEASQQFAYTNLQLEHYWKEEHQIKAGISYRYLDLNEEINFLETLVPRTYNDTYNKFESIPGVFAENTFNWQGKSKVLITGLRVDRHNIYGVLPTFRTMFKYEVRKETVARLSVGTGWRTIHLFSENTNLLASSRDLIISDKLQPEEAVNYGANLTHKAYINENILTLGLDVYRTRFLNQIFPDYDTDPTKAYINNFTGVSISNGIQVEAGYNMDEQVVVKIAYNYLDVYRMINDEKQVLPFNALHKIIGAVALQTKNEKWHFDFNVHWYGEQKLTNTSENPVDYQTGKTSDPYVLLNAQLTKYWDSFEVYAGCENIFDFRQDKPIMGWQDPFGDYFDTSNVWGPTKGREFYLGLRYKIKVSSNCFQKPSVL